MTMNFQSAAQRVRGLLAPKKASTLSKGALTDDRLRDNVIGETIASSERLQSATSRRPTVEGPDGPVVWDNFGDCLTDYMRASFGFDEPVVRPVEQVRPSHRLEREVIDASVHSPEFRDARRYTRANQLEATAGAIAYADSLTDAYAGLLREHVERSTDMGAEEQLQQSADDMFEQLRDKARKEVEEHGEVQDGTKRAIKQALKTLDASTERLGQLMQDEAQSTMAMDARAAARQAAGSAAEEVDAIGRLPGICKGDGMKLNPDQQLELARRWTQRPHLRKLAKYLGRRVKNMARARRNKLPTLRGAKVGVEPGNQLHKLVSRELARAASPVRAVRTLFVKDYVERQLMQYRTQLPTPIAKGAILAVLDGSRSMRDEPREWAGSLEIGLAAIASDESRTFGSVHFGSTHEQESWLFPKDEPIDPSRLVEMAEQFFDGGTNIAAALRAALDILRDEPDFKTADICLLTDGEDQFDEEARAIRDELRAMGVRIQGISILHPNNKYLAEMCDSYVDVSQLADDTRDEALGTLAANLT